MINQDVTQMMPVSLAKSGDIIRITEKLCSDTVQPKIRVGMRFYVDSVKTLKSGSLSLQIKPHKDSRKNYSINADRFRWEILSLSKLKNIIEKEIVDGDTNLIRNMFDTNEQGMICMTPLIIHHIAWEYAKIACRMAAEDKVSLLKHITRKVHDIEKRYYDCVKKDLDFSHRERVVEKAFDFRHKNDMDFRILYYTLSNIWLKQFPEYPYKEMRIHALMCQIMITICDEHNIAMDALMKSKIGSGRHSKRLPVMDDLFELMGAISGVIIKLDDPNLQNAIRIIVNRFMSIEYYKHELMV